MRSATTMRRGRAVHVAEVRGRRLRCRGCGHRWQLRPRGLVPNKHYQPSVVARGVAQLLRLVAKSVVAAALACSRRTVGRWVASLRGAMCGPAASLWEPYVRRVARLLQHARPMPEVAH